MVAVQHLPIVQVLLPYSDVNAVNKKKQTVLHLAARCGNVDVVRKLLPLVIGTILDIVCVIVQSLLWTSGAAVCLYML